MPRQLIIGLLIALVIGGLGGMGTLAVWQLQPDGGRAAALVKTLAAQVIPRHDGGGDEMRQYLTAVDELMIAVKGLGEWSNRDMFNLALEDWLARKDEDEKKKANDKKIELLEAILVAVGGQVPEDPPEDPVTCKKDSEKCTALLLRATRAEVENERKQLQNLTVPMGAQALNQMVLSYSAEVLTIFDKIIKAEQEDDKAEAVAAIYALRKLERNNYGLIEEELNRVIQGPSPISKMYGFLNPIER